MCSTNAIRIQLARAGKILKIEDFDKKSFYIPRVIFVVSLMLDKYNMRTECFRSFLYCAALKSCFSFLIAPDLPPFSVGFQLKGNSLRLVSHQFCIF